MSNLVSNASKRGWARLLQLRRALRRLTAATPRAVASAYDLWSATYDDEGDNLLVLLDEELFAGLLARIEVSGKRVVDVGCGTGRHWGKLLARAPAQLVGYDVSPGMLARLRSKNPGATVHLASAEALVHTAAGTCDLLISTLALSHVADADAAIREWARVLRDGGDSAAHGFPPGGRRRRRDHLRSARAGHRHREAGPSLAGAGGRARPGRLRARRPGRAAHR